MSRFRAHVGGVCIPRSYYVIELVQTQVPQGTLDDDVRNMVRLSLINQAGYPSSTSCQGNQPLLNSYIGIKTRTWLRFCWLSDVVYGMGRRLSRTIRLFTPDGSILQTAARGY